MQCSHSEAWLFLASIHLVNTLTAQRLLDFVLAGTNGLQISASSLLVVGLGNLLSGLSAVLGRLGIVWTVISPTEKSREFICNVTSYDPGEPCDGAGCTGSKSGVVNSGFKSLLNVRFGQVGEQGQFCRLWIPDVCSSRCFVSRTGPFLLLPTVAIASAEYGGLKLPHVSWEHYETWIWCVRDSAAVSEWTGWIVHVQKKIFDGVCK